MDEAGKYPEHEKLKAIKDELDAVNRFLDWCEDEKSARLYHYQTFTELSTDLYGDPRIDDDGNEKTYKTEQLTEFMPVRQKLMAMYFGIDMSRLEKEKMEMLRALRALNGVE